MPSIRQKRGTRAALNALATASQIKSGEVYVITDESRLAVGLTSSTYQVFSKLDEPRFLVPGTLPDGTNLGETHLNKSVLVNGGTINLFIDTAWANGDSIEFISSGSLPTILAWAGGSIMSQDTGAAATQVIGGATAASAFVEKIAPGVAFLFTGSTTGAAAARPALGSVTLNLPGQTQSYEQTISRPGTLATQSVRCWLAPTVDTGDNDIWQLEVVNVDAQCGVDSITFFFSSRYFESGAIKINYEVF